MTKIETARDRAKKTPVLKALIYGDTGTGKTSWCARAPRPLVLLTEAQGAVSLREWNPDALIIDVPSWDAFRKVWAQILKSAKVSTLGKLEKGREAGKVTLSPAMGEGEDAETPACGVQIGGQWVGFQTLIIDGLTDLQRVCMEAAYDDEFDGKRVAPTGDNEGDGFRIWRVTQQALIATMRDQARLPCSVIVTALERLDEKGEMAGKRRPALQGQMLGPTIGQFFNAVGHCHVSKGALAIHWKQSSQRIAKPASPRWPVRSYVDGKGGGSFGSLTMLQYPDQKVARVDGDDPSNAAGKAPAITKRPKG